MQISYISYQYTEWPGTTVLAITFFYCDTTLKKKKSSKSSCSVVLYVQHSLLLSLKSHENLVDTKYNNAVSEFHLYASWLSHYYCKNNLPKVIDEGKITKIHIKPKK